jgi:hypothetical protein
VFPPRWFESNLLQIKKESSVRLVVRTSPLQGGYAGSNPVQSKNLKKLGILKKENKSFRRKPGYLALGRNQRKEWKSEKQNPFVS